MTPTASERPSAHELVMTYPPLSQFLRMLVNKEIQDRLADGRIAAAQLPMHIQTIRIVIGKDGRVEINDEVPLEVEIKPNRSLISQEDSTSPPPTFSFCYRRAILTIRPTGFTRSLGLGLRPPTGIRRPRINPLPSGDRTGSAGLATTTHGDAEWTACGPCSNASSCAGGGGMKRPIDFMLQERHRDLLRTLLVHEDRVERAAYILCGTSRIASDPWERCPRERLTSFEVLDGPPDDVISASALLVTWSTRSFVRLLRARRTSSSWPASFMCIPATPPPSPNKMIATKRTLRN